MSERVIPFMIPGFEYLLEETAQKPEKKKQAKTKKSAGITMVEPKKKSRKKEKVNPFDGGGFAPVDIDPSSSFMTPPAPSYGTNVSTSEFYNIANTQVSNYTDFNGSKSKKLDKKEESDRPLSEFEQNTPSIDKFQRSLTMLENTIGQIEIGLAELKTDADRVRASNDRSKYRHITDINAAMGSYFTSKIAAIREINNTIKNCQEYDYKRHKDNMALEAGKDDAGLIMNDYRSFVNVPRGHVDFQPIAPSIMDMTFGANSVGYNLGEQAGYEQYVTNMTPAQHMMQLENNPYIQEVVMYDQSTGRRWFEVIDTRTNEPVPNADKYDMMLIDEFEIDQKKGIARSINMNITLPLVVIPSNTYF